MRSSRITRHIVRFVGGAAVSALLIGGVAAAPADAGAHGVRKPATTTVSTAHGV